MKYFVTLFIFFSFTTVSIAQKLNEMVNLDKYAKANDSVKSEMKSQKSIVFIGNSITEFWVVSDKEFFTSNKYIGRGISGQTSPQLLLRFRQDVIDLKPSAVVINIGTNDIAENTGTYNQRFTLDNIKSMAELATANGIRVILSSVLPAGEFPWRKEIKNIPKLVDALNLEIKKYADEKGYSYVDYNTAMRDSSGAMLKNLADDGVHPNIEGYKIMESLIIKEINEKKKQ